MNIKLLTYSHKENNKDTPNNSFYSTWFEIQFKYQI